MTRSRWSRSGAFARPRPWPNKATQELVEWLIEDLVGVEMVKVFWRVTTDDTNTPPVELGERVREIFTEVFPFQLPADWLATVDWTEVARYLIQAEVSK